MLPLKCRRGQVVCRAVLPAPSPSPPPPHLRPSRPLPHLRSPHPPSHRHCSLPPDSGVGLQGCLAHKKQPTPLGPGSEGGCAGASLTSTTPSLPLTSTTPSSRCRAASGPSLPRGGRVLASLSRGGPALASLLTSPAPSSNLLSDAGQGNLYAAQSFQRRPPYFHYPIFALPRCLLPIIFQRRVRLVRNFKFGVQNLPKITNLHHNNKTVNLRKVVKP